MLPSAKYLKTSCLFFLYKTWTQNYLFTHKCNNLNLAVFLPDYPQLHHNRAPDNKYCYKKKSISWSPEENPLYEYSEM